MRVSSTRRLALGLSVIREANKQIQDTISHLRETAKILLVGGSTDKASELMEEAAKLEDAASRRTLEARK